MILKLVSGLSVVKSPCTPGHPVRNVLPCADALAAWKFRASDFKLVGGLCLI